MRTSLEQSNSCMTIVNLLSAGHVRVVLGPDFVAPAGIDSASSSGESAAGVDTTAPSDAPNQGQPVDGHGIPCVD